MEYLDRLLKINEESVCKLSHDEVVSFASEYNNNVNFIEIYFRIHSLFEYREKHIAEYIALFGRIEVYMCYHEDNIEDLVDMLVSKGTAYPREFLDELYKLDKYDYSKGKFTILY